MFNDVKKEISGGKKDTTNNIMEITAVIEGLKHLKRPCEVEIYSDSAYVVNAFNNGWIYNWIKNNWKTSDSHIKCILFLFYSSFLDIFIIS